MRHDTSEKRKLNPLSEYPSNQHTEKHELWLCCFRSGGRGREQSTQRSTRRQAIWDFHQSFGERLYGNQVPSETSLNVHRCSAVHDWNQMQGALYLARWHKTFHIRLSLVLVSRAWHLVALRHLYSSLVFERCDSFEQTVTKLAASNLARWVHRVTLLDKIGNQYLQRVLGYLPNLRFL